MKKILKITIPILVIVAFTIMAFKRERKINHKKEVADFIQTMPKFEYKTLDNKVFTNKNLKPNSATVFIYFNSDCDFCNHEAQEIGSNIEKLKEVQLVFVSFEKPELIKKFAAMHKLNHYDNITIIHDSRVSFATTFDVKSLPSIVIYDKQNKLIAKLNGQTKVKNILKKLEISNTSN
jgi:peroxiredoxin